MPCQQSQWILGFVSAGVLLEGFFIGADREGLMIVRGPLHIETLNMAGGCLVTVHNPLMEVFVLGVLFAGVLRVIRFTLDQLRHVARGQ